MPPAAESEGVDLRGLLESLLRCAERRRGNSRCRAVVLDQLDDRDRTGEPADVKILPGPGRLSLSGLGLRCQKQCRNGASEHDRRTHQNSIVEGQHLRRLRDLPRDE